MTRSEQLSAMTEEDKQADILANIQAHGCIRITNRVALGFWGEAAQALSDAGKVTVTFVDHPEDQCSELVITAPKAP